MSSILRGLVKTVLNAVDSKKEEVNVVITPEDISQEELDRYSVQTEDINEATGYTNEDTMIKVPSPNLWSHWEYLHKPSLAGLDEIRKDRRLYFTLPSGWDMGEELEYWYLTFPLDGNTDDITEFYTPSRLDDVYKA